MDNKFLLVFIMNYFHQAVVYIYKDFFKEKYLFVILDSLKKGSSRPIGKYCSPTAVLNKYE